MRRTTSAVKLATDRSVLSNRPQNPKREDCARRPAYVESQRSWISEPLYISGRCAGVLPEKQIELRSVMLHMTHAVEQQLAKGEIE